MSALVDIVKSVLVHKFETRLLSVGSAMMLIPMATQFVVEGKYRADFGFITLGTDHPYNLASLIIGGLLILISIMLYWVKSGDSYSSSGASVSTLSETLKRNDATDLEIEESFFRQYKAIVSATAIKALAYGPGAFARLRDYKKGRRYLTFDGAQFHLTLKDGIKLRSLVFTTFYFISAIIAFFTYLLALIVLFSNLMLSLLCLGLLVTMVIFSWLALDNIASLHAAHRVVEFE